jgi:hypothetical protein
LHSGGCVIYIEVMDERISLSMQGSHFSMSNIDDDLTEYVFDFDEDMILTDEHLIRIKRILDAENTGELREPVALPPEIH